MSREAYRLDVAFELRKLVSQLTRESRVQGLSKTFGRSLGAIRRELMERRNEVGALWVRKNHAPTSSELVMRSLHIAPVWVLYAVHEASRTVWLRDVRLLPAL